MHNHDKLQQLIHLGIDIAHIQDIDTLLEKILTSARDLTNADAGTIYIKRGDQLCFNHTQNHALQSRLPSGEKLIYTSFKVPINPHSISGYVASTGQTLNIPDVYQLRPDDGSYAFDRSYDEKTNYRTQSMLTIPLKNNMLDIVGVMQLINAMNPDGEIVAFPEEEISLVHIFAHNAALAIERAQEKRSEILGLVGVLAELRDPEETEAHVNRVGAYSAEIYEAWAMSHHLPPHEIEKDSETIRMAAMLHDIGKLAIPQELRENAGKFTSEEYVQMKQHTIKGAQMLLSSAQSEYETIAAEIALNHHEYWNGSGYPGHVNPTTGRPLAGYENGNGNARGKREEEIPLFARIVAVADVYDALSCRRAFRDAMSENDVLRTLRHGAGQQYDPQVVEAFFSRINAVRTIGKRFPDER